MPHYFDKTSEHMMIITIFMSFLLIDE